MKSFWTNSVKILLALGIIAGGYWLFFTPDNQGSSATQKNILNNDFIRTDSRSQTRSKEIYGDYDCSDFNSQREAQKFFESEGGPRNDYHNLDRDGDGIACESI